MLLDPDNRVLMLRIHDSAAQRSMSSPGPDFWLLPGGGVEPGELYEEAAVREVFEETGICELTLGPCVWTAEHTTTWFDGAPIHIVERYYVARVAAGLTVTFAGHEPLEAATTVGYQWFTAGEIAERQARESFLPLGLAELLGSLVLSPGCSPCDGAETTI
jgi:8-oxo-dGTP pyrophosphatase MutT (NUDIX family)